MVLPGHPPPACGVSGIVDSRNLLVGAPAVALAAFVAIEARSAQPLLPLWIFADRNRAGVYLILLCPASVFFGMFFFLCLFTQLVWGYSALRGGLAYLPFIGRFIVIAGICTRLVSRVGTRVPMTIGVAVAPASMFWLSRVHEHSHYLTGVMLPPLVFAITAGLIFAPLTMTLVAGISDQHAGIASSMFNAGQQVGGAVGLAVIGSVAWTIVNNHVRSTIAASQPGIRHRRARRPAGQPHLPPRPDRRGSGGAVHRRGGLRPRADRHAGGHPGAPRRLARQPAPRMTLLEMGQLGTLVLMLSGGE
jgi:hypothetical protein